MRASAIYVFSGLLGLALAAALSSYWLAPGQAQAPSAKPEFETPPPPPPPPASDAGAASSEPVAEQPTEEVPADIPEAPAEAAPEAGDSSAPKGSAPGAEPAAGPEPGLEPEPIQAAPSGQRPMVDQLKAALLEPYIYDDERRRDPFAPFTAAQAFEDGAFQGPLLPLQRYDLDQLSLVGVLWDVNDPKAMFLDPNSQIHILGKDERIGRNNGYIAVIREGEVVVVETVMVRGEPAYTTRLLRMVQ